MVNLNTWKAVAVSELFITAGLLYMLTITAIETGYNRGLFRLPTSAIAASSLRANSTNDRKIRRILVDLGANCGNSYEFFKQHVSEFYLVEPQTVVFNQWLVSRASPTVHVYNAAVSDHDEENVTFFVDSPYASDVCTFDNGYPHGASSLDFVGATVNGIVPTQHNVRLLDIARFMRETVDASPEDYIILKIDIEGSEEPVLRRLMAENLLCLVDNLRVEWHASTQSFKKEFESSIFHYEEWIL